MSSLEDFETTDLLSELKRRYNCLGKPQGNFILLGPPGSGKGTQSALLKNSHCFCHLSTGDLFRDAIKRGTPTGLKVKEYLDKGQLVPDEITLGVIQDRINSPRCRRGFLLDGYPRNLGQVNDVGRGRPQLDKLLSTLGKKLNAVLYFRAPEEVVVKRITGRLVHPGSNRVYHKLFKPPKVEGRDDVTNEPLITRKDDTPELVRTRLDVYKRQTQPLVDHYRKLDLLRDVDANKKEEEITKVGAAHSQDVEKLIAKCK